MEKVKLQVHVLAIIASVLAMSEISYSTQDFILVEEKKSWEEGESHCKQLQGHLATVRSAEDNDKLVKLIQATTQHIRWIGLNDKGKEGDWKWISGDKSRYTNWNHGNPSGQNNHCVYMCTSIRGQWENYNCAATFPFICQVPAKQHTTTLAPTTTTTETPITAKAVHLVCNGQEMTATFNESYFPADILNITVPYCAKEKYEVHGNNTLHCKFDKCAKRIIENENVMTEENVVNVHVGYEDSAHLIQRSVLYSYTLRCKFNRKVLVDTDVAVEVKTITQDFTAEQYTNYSAKMEVYKTKDFFTVAKSPHIVTSADDIYVQISSSYTNDTLFKFVTTKCFATPEADSHSAFRYIFLENKCKLDKTFKVLNSVSTNRFRFKIHSFSFIKLTKSVYFHCEVLVCKKESSSAKCSQDCAISHRRRRSIEDEDEENERITVSSGEINWRETDDKMK